MGKIDNIVIFDHFIVHSLCVEKFNYILLQLYTSNQFRMILCLWGKFENVIFQKLNKSEKVK